MALRAAAGRVVNPRGDTAERIEKAAVDLFFREGYPKTSLREITSALGLTPGAFYNHFESKEALLSAVITRTHAVIEESIEQALLAAGEDAASQLWEVTRALTRIYTDRQKEAVISQRERHRLPGAEPTRMLERERQIRRAIERILTRGLESGDFRLTLPDGGAADLGVVAKMILDLIISAGSWFRPDGRLGVDDLSYQYATMIVQMVGLDPTALDGDRFRHRPD
ncbi:TetR/AcrR family transcriptional regulator [Nocardia wallacei]|uniref:TetR/AcrR family transcriptional regulator n=1 Tax=Nocardia wallacei TaxID=480035 RepID=UPI002459042B|nr:TetR/AcrR family transcriptional regulator [Nocardia wallacei]